MTLKTPINAVFFDLDGTLLDTAPDLADACNQILKKYHRAPIPLTEFRHWVHGGTLMMICKSFQINEQHPAYPGIKAEFIERYRQGLVQNTRLFAGMEHVLDYLEQQRIPWGVITNKQAWLTEPLLEHLGLKPRCCCIVSGDTLPQIKPHPAPLLHACKLVNSEPSHCVYIGDTSFDIQAAKAAGMMSIAVSYGYRPKDSHPQQWLADALIHTPQELLTLFKTLRRPS